MSLSKSNMRLFNGHLKMSDASLKKVFVMQLSNIYCIKSYLVLNLPLMALVASFADLKNAILENVEEIELQLTRMDIIYGILEEKYHPMQCIGIRALMIEAFSEIKLAGMSDLEKDLTMLYHLNSIESLEISSFTILHDLALSMPEIGLTVLLQQNLDLSKDSKELYEMITKEYIY